MNELVIFATMYLFAIVFHKSEEWWHHHRHPHEKRKPRSMIVSMIIAICAAPPTIEAGKHYFVHVVIATVIH